MQPGEYRVASAEASPPDDLGAGGTQIGGELPPHLLGDEPGKNARWPFLLLVPALLLSAYALGPEFPDPGVWTGFLRGPGQAMEPLPAFLPPYWHWPVQAIHGQAQGAIDRILMAGSALGTGLAALAAAGITAMLVSASLRSWQAVIFSGLAGYVLLLSAPAQHALHSAGPAGMTAAAALLGVFFYLSHCSELAGTRPGNGRLLLSALLLGAACVQQPYFLVLPVLLFAHALLTGPPAPRSAGVAVLAFGFALAWPTLEVLRAGTPPRELLDHLLHQPVPDFSLDPAAFPLDRVRRQPGLAEAFLLAVCVLGLRAGRLPRGPLLVLLTASVLLGPAAPYLASPPRETLVPTDLEGIALAGLGCLLSAAVAASASAIARLQRPCLRRVSGFAAVLSVAASALLFHAGESVSAPPWRERLRTPLATRPPLLEAAPMVEGLPPGAVIVTGGLDIAGALWGDAEIRARYRVFPESWLTEPAGRLAVGRLIGASLPEDFPDAGALARWKNELPMHLAGIAGAQRHEFDAELAPFALWDFANQRGMMETTFFLGVDVPWLLARGKVCGHALAYPGERAPGGVTVPPLEAPGAPWAARVAQVQSRAVALQEDAWKGDEEIRARLDGAITASDGRLDAAIRADTDLLWRAERLVPLRLAYEALLARPNPDPEVQFQLAAVFAQMGEWGRARAALDAWRTALGGEETVLTMRMEADSRFAVYKRWLALQRPFAGV